MTKPPGSQESLPGSDNLQPNLTEHQRAAAALARYHPHPIALFLTWGCMLAPVVLLLCVLSLAAHVRIGLGHWPRFNESYNTPAFSFHFWAIVGLGLFCMYGAPVLWLLLLCFRRLRLSWKVHLLQLGACVAAWGLNWLMIAWDPLRFVEWILD